MQTHTTNYKLRLGLFIIGGLILFVFAIFIIGKQKNLFNPVFNLTTTFNNVSGLQVGNNIRFSGINVGTVDNIRIINDSTVLVDMIIQKEVQKFIKTDSKVAIGGEGIIGDRVLVINQGSNGSPFAKSGQQLDSTEPVETEAVITKLKVTADNTAIISQQLAEIFIKVNKGNGTLARLIRDSTIAENIEQTIVNLKSSSKGLNENMEAVKGTILLRGYYNKKEKEAEKKKKEKMEANDKGN